MSLTLSSNKLKLIALVTMLIDHVGMVFFPKELLFREIGRIAFPIFIFLLVEGFFFTKSRRNYLLRLLVFSFISEIPFNLAISSKIFYPEKSNVFFTLALGLIVMILADRLYDRPPILFSELLSSVPAVIAILICFFIADVAHTDYGSTGVMAIGTGYILKKLGMHRCLVFAGIAASLTLVKPMEVYSFFALPLIFFYNGSLGSKSPLLRSFFYLFYPVHLLLLFFISRNL